MGYDQGIDDCGFDDQFNDGIFGASLYTSRLSRPHKWPRSVSEMRNYTTFWGQGMPGGHDTGHTVFMARRPYAPDRHTHGWVWTDHS